MINFAENFWGDKNNGYDVLYHNMKLGHVACQDLIEYLKESARVEESYNKSLGKLAAKVWSFVFGWTAESELGGFLHGFSGWYELMAIWLVWTIFA